MSSVLCCFTQNNYTTPPHDASAFHGIHPQPSQEATMANVIATLWNGTDEVLKHLINGTVNISRSFERTTSVLDSAVGTAGDILDASLALEALQAKRKLARAQALVDTSPTMSDDELAAAIDAM